MKPKPKESLPCFTVLLFLKPEVKCWHFYQNQFCDARNTGRRICNIAPYPYWHEPLDNRYKVRVCERAGCFIFAALRDPLPDPKPDPGFALEIIILDDSPDGALARLERNETAGTLRAQDIRNAHRQSAA